jgi:nicotinamide-nucleotide amidase
MKIAIISLGDELLLGATINTNAAFIASNLQINGLNPSLHLTLPDAEIPITEYFNLLISQYDLILVTGGLGPTKDDITKNIISKIFNRELTYIPAIAEYLTKKYPNLSIGLESQASIPKGAKYFLNSFGTAPGFMLENNGSYAAFMPGVPTEMQPMLTTQILPYLLSLKKFKTLSPVFNRTIVLFKIFETKINDFLVDLQNIYPNFSFGLYPDLGILKVVLYANSANVNIQAEQEITIVASKIQLEFAGYFLNTNNSNLAAVIAEYLTKHKLTLALAESITGGAYLEPQIFFLVALLAIRNRRKLSI